MNLGKVLFIDDEDHLRHASKQAIDLAGYEVESFSSAELIPDYISRNFNGIVVSDIRMPDLDGMSLMHTLLEIDPELPVVLITGHGDVQLAVEAMRAGAYDFIEKPFASKHLVEVVGRALEKRVLTLEIRELRSAVGRRDRLEARLTGRSNVILNIRKQIRSVAPTDADVLIIGDTGTGKEVAARALHALSSRRENHFVAINCGAIPVDMIERELFGHEVGAFPGAVRSRYGKFQHANGGTVFLDEIESMPIELQVKLLHVIQDRTITPLGSNDPINLDVRFIATSKSDLEAASAEGRFRSDLLYRLNVVTIRMPSLEQRKEDIPSLFVQLVNEAAARYRKEISEVPSSILSEIASRSWPGNVRELRNEADRYALGLIHQNTDEQSANTSKVLNDRVAEFEANLIAAELTANKGNLKATYEALGLSRKTLYEKMQKYNLKREDF